MQGCGSAPDTPRDLRGDGAAAACGDARASAVVPAGALCAPRQIDHRLRLNLRELLHRVDRVLAHRVLAGERDLRGGGEGGGEGGGGWRRAWLWGARLRWW